MNNSDIIQKAAMAVSDLTGEGAGGYLNPMQSEKFLRGIIDQPTIIKACRSITIKGESKKIEKIGFGQRIMRAAEENVALDSKDYAKPTTGKVDLNTKEVIAEVRISYDTLEANIEGQNLKNTIIQMIQERCALDLEELVLNGDSTSDDSYLATFDGFLKLAQDHVYNFQGAEITTDTFRAIRQTVPDKYFRVLNQWKWYLPHKLEQDYKALIAKRNTAVGDRYLLDNQPIVAQSIPIIPVAMIQANQTYSGSQGTILEAPKTNLGQILLTNPQNFIIGFTRRVQMEMDKDISARQIIIVVTLKAGVAIEETDAVGKGIHVAARAYDLGDE